MPEVFYRFIYFIQLWFTKYLPIIQLINTNKTILKYNRNQNYIILQLQTQFTTAGSRFPVFNVFLKILNLVNVLNLFGTVFHIRPSSKQRACVPYLEVLVSGNFNNCLLWRSYRVFFKSKKNVLWLVDLYYLLTYIFQWITYACYFHEHSMSYLLIVDLRNLHFPFHIIGAEYVCVFHLFDCFKFYYRISRSKGSI